MADNFMDKLRSFLGIRLEQPRNEFRNPIWGDDDDDDDELYDRHSSIDLHTDVNLHFEITRQMQSMLRTFSEMMTGDNIRTFFHDGPLQIPEPDEDLPDESSGNSIREYYLKPGYQMDRRGDMDLDGKISSSEISGLLKNNAEAGTMTPFDGNLVPGRSFCQTVITTSITKPDGTTETRKIVKHGNGVTEDITTTTSPTGRGPKGPNVDPIVSPVDVDVDAIYKGFMRDFTSQWRNFN